MQKNYQETEKFMNELPKNLRNLVIKKTHGPIIEKIKFFSNRNSDFNSAIIYELKHMNLGSGELIYQQNDMVDQIYFIYHGKFKLFVDLNTFIKNEKVFAEIQKRHKMMADHKVDMNSKDEIDEENKQNNFIAPNFQPIIQYLEGSYFGDADYFAMHQLLDDRGRDSTAIA